MATTLMILASVGVCANLTMIRIRLPRRLPVCSADQDGRVERHRPKNLGGIDKKIWRGFCSPSSTRFSPKRPAPSPHRDFTGHGQVVHRNFPVEQVFDSNVCSNVQQTRLG